MSDRYDQDRLLDYLEDEMSAAEREAFERTLATDVAMRRLLGELRSDRALLHEAADQPAPAGLMERAQTFLERQMLMGGLPEDAEMLQGRRSVHTARWVALGGLAAMVLLSAGLIVFMFMDTTSLNDAAEQTTAAPYPTSGMAQRATAERDGREAQHTIARSDRASELVAREEVGRAEDGDGSQRRVLAAAGLTAGSATSLAGDAAGDAEPSAARAKARAWDATPPLRPGQTGGLSGVARLSEASGVGHEDVVDDGLSRWREPAASWLAGAGVADAADAPPMVLTKPLASAAGVSAAGSADDFPLPMVEASRLLGFTADEAATAKANVTASATASAMRGGDLASEHLDATSSLIGQARQGDRVGTSATVVDVRVTVPAAGTVQVRTLLAHWVEERGGTVVSGMTPFLESGDSDSTRRVERANRSRSRGAAPRAAPARQGVAPPPLEILLPVRDWPALLALLRGETGRNGETRGRETEEDAVSTGPLTVVWRDGGRGTSLVMRDVLRTMGVISEPATAPLSIEIAFTPALPSDPSADGPAAVSHDAR